MFTADMGAERLVLGDAKVLMPEGRQPYCRVRNVLETTIDERNVSAVLSAEQALTEVVDSGDILRPPLPEKAIGVIKQAVKQSADDRAEYMGVCTLASDQRMQESAQVVWALMQVVYEHGYQAPTVVRPIASVR